MKSTRGRIIIAASILLVVATAGWASGVREKTASGEQAGSGGVTLRVATLRGPTGMGMVPLIEQGPALAPGVSVSYEVVGTPEVMVSRILGGNVDLASLPVNLAAKLYNSGVAYKLAAVNVLGVLYLVSDRADIHSLADLKGRTVYLTGKGANPDFLMRFALSKAGLNPGRDVSLDFRYDQVELSSLLASGRVHTALLPEPFVTEVVEKNPRDRVVLRFEDAWKAALGRNVPLAQGCLVVRAETARLHPLAVRRFLDSYRQAVHWVNAHPERAGVLIEKQHMGLNARAAADALPRMSLVYEPAEQSRKSVEEFLSVLLHFSPRSIGGKLPDSGFYLSQ